MRNFAIFDFLSERYFQKYPLVSNNEPFDRIIKGSLRLHRPIITPSTLRCQSQQSSSGSPFPIKGMLLFTKATPVGFLYHIWTRVRHATALAPAMFCSKGILHAHKCSWSHPVRIFHGYRFIDCATAATISYTGLGRVTISPGFCLLVFSATAFAVLHQSIFITTHDLYVEWILPGLGICHVNVFHYEIESLVADHCKPLNLWRGARKRTKTRCA